MLLKHVHFQEQSIQIMTSSIEVYFKKRIVRVQLTRESLPFFY